MPPSKQIEKVELFLSKESNKFVYKGLCKVGINLATRILAVKLNDKDQTVIDVPFYYPFVTHKNLLCHVSPTKLHDIVLIFPTEADCKDVYSILLKYQVKVKKDTVADADIFAQLKDRILVPLSNEVVDTPNINGNTRDIVMRILNPVEPQQQDVKNAVLKSELSELPPPPVPCETNCSPIILQLPFLDTEAETSLLGKRKNPTKSSCDAVTTALSNMNKKCKMEEVPVVEKDAVASNTVLTKRFLDLGDYKIQTLFKKSIKKQKLFVFCSLEKNLCYIYDFETKGKRFMCERCKDLNRIVVAHIRNRQDGSEFVELGLLTHTCRPIPYAPSLQTSSNGFMGFGALSGMSAFGSSNGMLSLLNSPSTSTSTSFNAVNKTSAVAPGKLSNLENDESANLCQDLIKIKSEKTGLPENVAKDGAVITAEPKIVNETPKILKSSDYEIQKNDTRRQRLIVFYPDNRNFCFPYAFDVNNDRFVCNRCRRFKRSVVAHVCYDSNGDQYIELGSLNHLCPPIAYNYSPALENDPDDSPDSPSSGSNEFEDENSERSTSDTRNSESPFEENDGIEGEETFDNFDEPTSSKSKAESNEEIDESPCSSSTVKSPFFEIQMTSNNCNRSVKPQLLVFPYSDKQLCYYYYYDASHDYFICGKCRKRLHYVIAQLKKDKNGEHFVTLNDKPHICLPMPYRNADERRDNAGINLYSIEQYKRRELRKEFKTGKKAAKEKESVEMFRSAEFNTGLPEHVLMDDAANEEECDPFSPAFDLSKSGDYYAEKEEVEDVEKLFNA